MDFLTFIAGPPRGPRYAVPLQTAHFRCRAGAQVVWPVLRRRAGQAGEVQSAAAPIGSLIPSLTARKDSARCAQRSFFRVALTARASRTMPKSRGRRWRKSVDTPVLLTGRTRPREQEGLGPRRYESRSVTRPSVAATPPSSSRVLVPAFGPAGGLPRPAGRPGRLAQWVDALTAAKI